MFLLLFITHNTNNDLGKLTFLGPEGLWLWLPAQFTSQLNLLLGGQDSPTLFHNLTSTGSDLCGPGTTVLIHRLQMAGSPECDVRMGRAREAVSATSCAAQPACSLSPHRTLRTASLLSFTEQEQQDPGLHQEKKREGAQRSEQGQPLLPAGATNLGSVQACKKPGPRGRAGTGWVRSGRDSVGDLDRGCTLKTKDFPTTLMGSMSRDMTVLTINPDHKL